MGIIHYVALYIQGGAAFAAAVMATALWKRDPWYTETDLSGLVVIYLLVLLFWVPIVVWAYVRKAFN